MESPDVYGPVLAYAGHRAVLRKSTTGMVRHAVYQLTVDTGLALPDSECGELGYIPLGPWNPDDPHNCKACTKVLAGAELPEVVRRVQQPDTRPLLPPISEPVQLTLFADVA